MKDGTDTENLIDDDKSDLSNEGDKKNGSADSDPAEKKYKWGGKMLTADEYFEATQNLQKDYTIKSQKLSELESKNGNQSDSDKNTISEKDQEVIKQLKAWGFLTASQVDEIFDKKTPEIRKQSSAAAAMQVEIKQDLSNLKKQYDGSEETLADSSKVKKPKVDENKVLEFMSQHAAPISAEDAAKAVYANEFMEYEVRKRIAGGSKPNKTLKTEDAGTGTPETPGKKPPTFNDGSAEDRIREKFGVKPRVSIGGR